MPDPLYYQTGYKPVSTPNYSGVGDKPFSLPSDRARVGKLSVSEMMANNQKGGAFLGTATNPMTGQRIGAREAAERGPFNFTIGAASRGGRGGGGYGHGGGGYGGGGYGGMREPMGSAAGALGSPGIPTSQRGRFQKAIEGGASMGDATQFAGMTTSAASDLYQKNTSPLNGMRMPMYARGTPDSGPKAKTAIVGERGPEMVQLPAHSKVVPNEFMDQFQSAIDEVAPAEAMVPSGPTDGEIRRDTEGNEWRYDAAQGRGIPVNPYLRHPNAPSRNAFRATADDRYNDLSQRLGALRAEGLAQGRARVREMQAANALEKAQSDALIASGKPISAKDGGGSLIQTPYGPIILGGNRPKSFTVNNPDGTSTVVPGPLSTPAGRVLSPENPSRGLVDKLSASAAAEADARAYQGQPVNFQPRVIPQPTAIEEVAGPIIEPAQVTPASVASGALPDDRPSVFSAQNRRRLGFIPNAPKQNIAMPLSPPSAALRGAAPSRFRELLMQQSMDANNALSKAVKPVQSAYDYLFAPQSTF